MGSHLAKKLVEEHEVTVGGLAPESSVLELPEELERERIDVTDRLTLDFSGYDCVIHLVALSPLKKPSVPYHHIHVDGTKNVVKQAEEDEVGTYFHMSALGADPDADTEYLRTKGEAEKIVQSSDLDWRIFRPSVIFGEGGEFLNFTSQMTVPYLTVLPGKYTSFQPVHVEDITELIARSLDESHSGKIFEIGGPEKLALGQIAKMVDKSKGRELKTFSLPDTFFLGSMMISEQLPLSPFGIDQYRSLRSDNVPDKNQVEELGLEPEEMKRLRDYLEL